MWHFYCYFLNFVQLDKVAGNIGTSMSHMSTIAQCMWIKANFVQAPHCFKSSHCESLCQVLGTSSVE